MASRIQRDRSRSDGVCSLEHAFAKVMMKLTRVILEITPPAMSSSKNAFVRYMAY